MKVAVAVDFSGGQLRDYLFCAFMRHRDLQFMFCSTPFRDDLGNSSRKLGSKRPGLVDAR